MQQILATDVQKDFMLVMNQAQQEPIIVRENDRNYVAIISMEDYEELVRLKNRRLKRLSEDLAQEAESKGLTVEILNEILDSDT
ncbi:MAG: type II toxin-antitoxin system Phd/YefM family antitoxin [Synechocystis sp.]|nr:type II toxin-antitoxin system Phd/YefM family antitoxin [Synechocystis sp.]